MRVAASNRVLVALWMAIEALETEAQALRLSATLARDGEDDVVGLAAQAERDAEVLRKLAGSHVLPGTDDAVAHDG